MRRGTLVVAFGRSGRRVAAGLPDGDGERILGDPACGKFPTTRYRVVGSYHDGGHGGTATCPLEVTLAAASIMPPYIYPNSNESTSPTALACSAPSEGRRPRSRVPDINGLCPGSQMLAIGRSCEGCPQAAQPERA